MMLFFLFGILSAEETPQEPLLILNMLDAPGKLPIHFRTSSTPFKDKKGPIPSRKGLDTLNIAGSGQFAPEALKLVIQKLNNPKKLVVIDLRQESHGMLFGSTPDGKKASLALSWYTFRDWANRKMTDKAIQENEEELLQLLRQMSTVKVGHILTKNLQGAVGEVSWSTYRVNKVASEKEVVEALGASYHRIYVTDHLPPTDEDVKQFLSIIKNLDSDTCIYFHCEAGDGRTTTFMAMYDMIKNAKEVSLEDIIRRQYLIGGIDLFKLPKEVSWKTPLLQKRIEFLKKFYEEEE